jgi:hypothetical protein
MRRFCLAIVALFALAAPAAAGGCCGYGYGAAAYDIQPVVPVSTYRFDAPPPVSQVYVVNQGPVLSGPGIYTYTNHYEPSFVPAAYPYVGGCGGYGGCGHAFSYGCGGYGCGQTYGYGCCGQTYSYGSGCCGRGLFTSGWGTTGTAGWGTTGWGTPGYVGDRHYRAYRAWRRHPAPVARTGY